MAETIKTTEHFYTKEFGSYGNKDDNFVANQEITVSITLNEYRSLVEKSAQSTQKIEEARSSMYKIQTERDELKKAVCSLKEELYNLQNSIKKESEAVD